jgi:hypothetical protein
LASKFEAKQRANLIKFWLVTVSFAIVGGVLCALPFKVPEPDSIPTTYLLTDWLQILSVCGKVLGFGGSLGLALPCSAGVSVCKGLVLISCRLAFIGGWFSVVTLFKSYRRKFQGLGRFAVILTVPTLFSLANDALLVQKRLHADRVGTIYC